MKNNNLSVFKKIVLITFFSLFFKSGFAQYDSLVVEHAVWIIDAYQHPHILPDDTVYGYYLNGDTIVNAKAYKKVYALYFKNYNSGHLPSNYIPYVITGQLLYALIRESNDTVYSISFYNGLFSPSTCAWGNDTMLYRFNYSVGDTLLGCIHPPPFPFYVQIVDSIVYPSFYGHRAFYADGNNYYLLEGIGTNYGLFEPMEPPFSGNYGFELLSYCKGDLQSCGLGFVNNIEHEATTPILYVYQNNDHSVKIEIKGNESNKKYSYTFETIDGRNVLQGNFTGNSYQLPLNNNITTGIYIFSIICDNHKIFKKINLNF